MALLPREVKTCLWSYDTEALDVRRDKERIIFSVLNYGGERAARWLFKTYPRGDIARTLERTPRSEWSKKSLNFWSTVFDVRPAHLTRFG